MTTYTTQKISQRTAAGTLDGNEIFPLVRTGDAGDYRSTIAAIATYLLTNPDILTLIEDKFGEHIASGEFDALLQEIQQRNAADTATWSQAVDVSGNWVFGPESGLEGALVLNGQGNVTLGLTTFRTQVVSDTSTSYQLSGQTNKARVTRFSPAGACTVNLVQDSAAPTLNDRFFDSDWFVLERGNAQTLTLSPGAGVTITNAYTGATGSVSVTCLGGQMLVRRITTNSYRVWGDIPRRTVGSVVTVASSSGALNFDVSLADYYIRTANEDVTSITFSNTSSDAAHTIVFKSKNHASSPKTISGWPAVKWEGGVTPTATAANGAIDEYALTFYPDGDITGKYGLAFG